MYADVIVREIATVRHVHTIPYLHIILFSTPNRYLVCMFEHGSKMPNNNIEIWPNRGKQLSKWSPRGPSVFFYWSFVLAKRPGNSIQQ